MTGTYTGTLTCSNSPTSVGPGVGSGTVTPSVIGDTTNFSVTPVNGAWSISKAPALATVTVTTDKGQNSTQYSDTVSFAITVSPVRGVSPLNPSPNCGAGITYCVSIKIGTQMFGPIGLTLNGTGSALVGSLTTQQVFLAPDSYTANLVIGDGTNNLSTVNSNYNLSPAILPNGNFSVTQEDAAVGYNGTTYFAVPSTQTTVNIPASFTLQDATATGVANSIYDAYPGDITRTGTVVISLSGSYVTSSGNQSNFNAPSCTVPVSAVLGQVGSNGLPSTATTGPCNFSSVPVNGTYQLTIAPGPGSYFTFAAGSDTLVTISTSNGGGGFITGGGYQTAKYLTSNPSGTGAKPLSLLGTMAAKMNFGYIAKYNKSGSNLQASANIIVRTSCMTAAAIQQLGLNYTPYPGNDGLCAYQIKSNKVISMTDNPYVSACTSTSTACTPGYGVLVVGANIQDVTSPNPVPVMGGGTLQLVMYDNSEPGIGKRYAHHSSHRQQRTTVVLQQLDRYQDRHLQRTLTGKADPYAPVINGGNLQVH